MTLSKTFKALLTRIRRTITRTLRVTNLKNAKLTISFPPGISKPPLMSLNGSTKPGQLQWRNEESDVAVAAP